MDAGKRTINEIFNGHKLLEIPFFQRAYVWDEEQWDRLLDDMETISKKNTPYFLGSIILKQQLTTSDDTIGDRRIIIDGQQRLTTLNIFFKVLFLKIEQNQHFNQIFRLMLNKELAILHNHNDIDSFQKILSLETLDDIEGEDNLTRAYRYFNKHIDTEKLNVSNILTNILFVGVDLNQDEDEQQIFDTINSLGVRLTTSELLKNYFFNRDDVDTYNKYWKDIFESDEETKAYWDNELTTGRIKRSVLDLFFYSYIQIKYQEPELKVTTEDKLLFSKVESLFESYKSLIKNYGLSKIEVLKEIQEYAALFKRFIDPKIIEGEISSDYGDERINAIIFGLDTSTLIPYVLYILRNIDSDEERNSLFQIIEAFIMRRMVCHETTKNYNQLFNDRLISNNILSKEEFITFINSREEGVNFMPNDEDLRKGFDESKLTNKQAAGILYLIESKIRDRNRQSTMLLGISQYSLEHLMPKKWANNWSKLNSQEEIDNRNRKLLTLGNLAIITKSLNSTIRDSSWSRKKDGDAKRPGLIKYSSGIETLSKYLNIGDWNEAEIQKRANDLFIFAKEIWRIN